MIGVHRTRKKKPDAAPIAIHSNRSLSWCWSGCFSSVNNFHLDQFWIIYPEEMHDGLSKKTDARPLKSSAADLLGRDRR
jgi:hypothetical protein